MTGDTSGSSLAGLSPVALFFGLAYGISWSAAGALHLVARAAGLPHFGTLMGMAESSFDLASVADRLPSPSPPSSS